MTLDEGLAELSVYNVVHVYRWKNNFKTTNEAFDINKPCLEAHFNSYYVFLFHLFTSKYASSVTRLIGCVTLAMP